MKRITKIMIVDDNLIDQMITARILKTSYAENEIIMMGSASEALDYLNTHINEPDLLPSLILLDLDMPIMNGFGFLHQFNNYTDSIKESCQIVVLTASDVLADIEQMQSHPSVTKLIAKPLDKHSLAPVMA